MTWISNATFTPTLIKIALIFGITYLFMAISDLLFTRAIKKNNRIHMKFMKGLMRTLFLLIGIIVLGMQFQPTKELASILVRNTALLVAILGFAAQQTLNDILSGFMISWYKPFDIGARIHLVSQNITGIVEDLTLRHTVIRAFDNNRIIIPNSVINKEILKNSDYEDSVTGNYLEIGISAASDIHMAMDLISDIIITHPSIITNEIYQPGILVKSLSHDGFLVKATVWTKTVDENFEACSDIRIAIQEAFSAGGIKLL